jgi:hypothetical protein
MAKEPDRRGKPEDSTPVVGRRRAVRHPRSVKVECLAPDGMRFAARTIDLSREGSLIEILDPRFLTSPDIATLVPFAARVAEEFGRGLVILFAGGALRVPARVVRLASGTRRLSPMRIGCRFESPLTDWACRMLRLELESDETGGAEAPSAEGGDEAISWLDPTRLREAREAASGPSASSDGIEGETPRERARRRSRGKP